MYMRFGENVFQGDSSSKILSCIAAVLVLSLFVPKLFYFWYLGKATWFIIAAFPE